MSAYYGGRAECRIRRTPVPVVYCDFLSMYPTVCGLMGLWELLTAKEVQVEEQAAESVAELLEQLTVADCFDPRLWRSLVGIAQVEPDGDILPVRARYSDGPSWQIGVNPLYSREPLWFPVADLVASKILTGKPVRVVRAVWLSPSRAPCSGLESLELLGQSEVDPAGDDFFQTLVEERHRAERRMDLSKAEREWRTEVKVLANATSYGIYAQMTRHELGGARREQATIYGVRDNPWRRALSAPEDPGEFAFPPVAASITGGARLMLALLERRVTEAGGTYAFCDTDSMTIVASEQGGLVPCTGGAERTDAGEEAVRALSWAEVDRVRDQFESLKPYSRELVRDPLLELEDENFAEPATPSRGLRQLWCYAISAKRYVLYHRSDRGEPVLQGWSEFDAGADVGEPEEPPDRLLKPSEHGLGHLLNPVDPESEDRQWIRQAWEHLLRADHPAGADGPEWLDRPAVARMTVSSPRLRRLFDPLNDGKAYDKSSRSTS